MKKYVEVSQAKEFAGTFLGDPILKMAVNAALDHVPAADVLQMNSAEKQAIFRLGQMDMQKAAVDMLLDQANGTHGVVCATLIDAAEWVRQLEVLHGVCD